MNAHQHVVVHYRRRPDPYLTPAHHPFANLARRRTRSMLKQSSAQPYQYLSTSFRIRTTSYS
jgi:hypothetical protein